MDESREVFVEDAMPRDRLALLLDHFSQIDDDRDPARVAYPLSEVLLLVTCATIAPAMKASTSPPCPSISNALPTGHEVTGALKACTGCSTSSSRMTSRAIEVAAGPRTWRPSDASPSASCARTSQRAASKPEENQQVGTPTTAQIQRRTNNEHFC